MQHMGIKVECRTSPQLHEVAQAISMQEQWPAPQHEQTRRLRVVDGFLTRFYQKLQGSTKSSTYFPRDRRKSSSPWASTYGEARKVALQQGTYRFASHTRFMASTCTFAYRFLRMMSSRVILVRRKQQAPPPHARECVKHMPCCEGPLQVRLPQHTITPHRRHKAGSLGFLLQTEHARSPSSKYQSCVGRAVRRRWI
jgi:hypothetical protein